MFIKKLSYEYIRGLIDGEGCFSFMAQEKGRHIIPSFAIAMSNRDRDLIISVRDSLNLRNRIYTYKPRTRNDGYKRLGMTILVVRDVGQLKNMIVPLCYKKLNGYKSFQFQKWIERIGTDPLVPRSYKIIHLLYKSGFYDKNPKYL